jgi:molecular chaperone DnaK
MAVQNRTLGRFDLVGIPPAPRGVPQVEVTFDIDANGIVHVSAKDLGTGKEQKIRIESSSGLGEDEISRMVKEAETHAAEDRVEREKVEARNESESLLYSTEKSLNELGQKVSESERTAVQASLAELRAALDSGDEALIKGRSEALRASAYHLAEEVYKDARGARAGGKAKGPRAGAESADYEVVDGGKPKN